MTDCVADRRTGQIPRRGDPTKRFGRADARYFLTETLAERCYDIAVGTFYIFVKADVVFVPLRDKSFGAGRNGIFLWAQSRGDVEVRVTSDVPAKKQLERRETFIESFSQSGESEMLGEIVRRELKDFVIAITSKEIGIVPSPGNQLSLDVVVGCAEGVFFQGKRLQTFVLRMQTVMAHEIIFRQDTRDRFADKRDVGGRPRQSRVQPKRHVPIENTHAREFFRPHAHEPAMRPAKVTWVDGIDRPRRVLPLDEAVERNARHILASEGK